MIVVLLLATVVLAQEPPAILFEESLPTSTGLPQKSPQPVSARDGNLKKKLIIFQEFLSFFTQLRGTGICIYSFKTHTESIYYLFAVLAK
jgi:hypothetical protein